MSKKLIITPALGLPNDKEIVDEYKRLYKLFEEMPEKQLKLARKLVSRAAFLAITLDRLEADIVENGYTETYQNGANQSGIKKSSAAELHVAYSKNLVMVMRQLTDLLPKAGDIPDGADDYESF